MMLYHKLTKPNTQFRKLTSSAVGNTHVLLPVSILFQHLFTEYLSPKASNCILVHQWVNRKTLEIYEEA